MNRRSFFTALAAITGLAVAPKALAEKACKLTAQEAFRRYCAELDEHLRSCVLYGYDRNALQLTSTGPLGFPVDI